MLDNIDILVTINNCYLFPNHKPILQLCIILMELLLKVIIDTLNVVPESFYDKCSNLDLGTNVSRVDDYCLPNDV